MWPNTVQYIQKLQQEAKAEGYPLWFRGQRNAAWPLLSSMHRNVNECFEQVLNVPPESVPEPEKIQLMRDAYKSLFHKFKARAVQLLPVHERSDWGLIFAMQHLGLPTGLLDWTESFPCALYFAQRHRNRLDDAAIFVFLPQQHNKAVLGSEGLVSLGGDANKRTVVETHPYHPAILAGAGDMETLAIAPELTNVRMTAQQAAFTLCGASFQAMEQRYPQSIKKIVLPANEFDDAQGFLDLVGQTHFGYFPDIEGLREYLLEEMKQEIVLAKKYRSNPQAPTT